MSFKTSRLRPALPALLVAALAGCSAVDSAEPTPCPPIGFLGDTERLVRYVGTPGDPDNLVLRAEFVGYSAECEATDEGTEVALTLMMDVTRGPAARGDDVELPFYVAVPAYFPKPQAKAIFTAAVDLPGEEGATRRHEDPGVRVTVPASAPAEAGIFVGFQLSEDELRFNRGEAR